MSGHPSWSELMRRERAANHDRPEHGDRDTAEWHAAADRSGLPGVRRHRGQVLPDGAPERWEVDGE